MYWRGDVPNHVKNKRLVQGEWDHGYSYWEHVTPSALRYMCKYVQKNDDTEWQGKLFMSKKPPLGARYFAERAGAFVDAGLAPQDAFYRFPEQKKKDGSLIQFMLKGRSLELFLQSYLDQWRERYLDHYPNSTLVEEYEDTLVPDKEFVIDRVVRHKEMFPWFLPALCTKDEVKIDEVTNSYYIDVVNSSALDIHFGEPALAGPVYRLYWSYDEKGERAWQEKIRGPVPVTLASTVDLRAQAGWSYSDHKITGPYRRGQKLTKS